MRKFLKFSIIFWIIAGIFFSNIPFYALRSLLDSYIASYNIVDTAWHLSQDKNIVDKFTSYRNLAERVKIHEARAAVTYQTNGAINYSASGGASVSPAYPTGVATNDLLVVIIGMKPSVANGGSVTTPGGWTVIPGGSLTGAGGYGTTLGADTGNTNVFTFYKIAVGGETGSQAFSLSQNGVSWGQMYRLSCVQGCTWSLAASTGSDTTGNNVVSIVTGSNPGVTAGDFILASMVIPTDVTTPNHFSSEAFSQTGATFGTVTEISEPDSQTGNDIGGFVVRGPVNSGTGSVAPTITAAVAGTALANVRGPGVFIRIREIPPANALAVSTIGSQAATLNSGDTAQHIGGGGTAAFRLQMSSSASTVTNVKLTETGTVELADLTTAKLYYESVSSCAYNGTESNVAASPVGETITFNLGGTAVPIAPNYLCLYFVFDVDGGATGTRGGQSLDVEISNPSTDVTVGSGDNSDTAVKALSGATTILPNAVSATFGSGLADGARSGEAVTITGFGFGAPGAGAGRENCSGAVDTGCVRFISGGNATVANADIAIWTNTSISFTVAASLASFGASSAALEVVAGGQGDSSDLAYLIYPNITGIASLGSNAGREYAAGDTDGLLMIQGDHFGATAGTVAFTGGFGSVAATIHATAEGSCGTGGWAAGAFSGNTVCVEVNSSISDSAITGTITLSRNSDSKSDFIDFRILPRILSVSPTSGVIGDVVQVSGNHFCQSGTCPIAGNRSTVSDNLTFGAAQAAESDFSNLTGGAGACNGSGAAWTQTEICVKVPSSASTGSAPVGLTSNTFDSNTKAFTVASTVPNDPTNLQQFKSDGITEISPVGSGANGATVVLEGDISASIAVTMVFEVEVKEIATPFDGTVTGSSVNMNGTNFANVSVTVSGLTNSSSYHWRARARNVNTGETSAWINFGGNSEGPPAAADFYIDTTGPTITFPNADTCADAVSNVTDQGATITWNTSDNINGNQAKVQVIYSTNADLSASSQTSETALESSPHVVNLSTLSAATAYYFKVRSRDALLNQTERPAGLPYCSFLTSAPITRIMKTVEFFAAQRDQIVGAGTTNSTFPVYIVEASPTVRSAYLEIRGVMVGTGSGVPSLGIRVNNQTTLTVDLPNTSSPQPFKIRYNLPSVAVQSVCTLPVQDQNALCVDGANSNTLYVTTDADVNKISLLSAKLILTYHYSP